jgi:cell fate regulator YaaT (PSP1 superfamily)
VTRIVAVVFRGGGKVYQFDAGTLELGVGDHVVVDTARGLDFGRVVSAPEETPPESVPAGLKRAVRRADATTSRP